MRATAMRMSLRSWRWLDALRGHAKLVKAMRVDCPRCGQVIAGVDVDLKSQLAVCRPCGEVVSLAAALALRPPVQLEAAPSGGVLYRPIDLAWLEEPNASGASTVVVTPPRTAAVPLAAWSLVWVALCLCWLPLLVEHPPVLVLLFPFVHFVLAAKAVYRAACGLVNRIVVGIDGSGFVFLRRPIREGRDVREPRSNVAGFEASSLVLRRTMGGATVRWGVLLLTRDRRAIPLYFDFIDASHAKYATARLTQLLADTHRDDAPYR